MSGLIFSHCFVDGVDGAAILAAIPLYYNENVMILRGAIGVGSAIEEAQNVQVSPEGQKFRTVGCYDVQACITTEVIHFNSTEIAGYSAAFVELYIVTCMHVES